MTRTRTLVLLTAVLGALAWTAAAPAEPALAAARVTVANADGRAEADPDHATQVTVTGTGFQAVPGAFGGVYVAFGTVEPGWQPSKGGVSGVDFRYVPDSESADNAGFQRFVAFPGSSTSREAHTTMSESGEWTVTMTVPGATFETTGRSGGTETVDCRRVTCGVITFGGHGVVNANNETFTPVSFTAGSGSEDEKTPAADDATSPEGEEARAVVVEPEIEVDPATAVVGRVLTFTARGFEPGEQLVGSLGAGLAAVGPLVAGAHGEVAGALQLPGDLRAGGHQLALTGAASGLRATALLEVAAAPAPPVLPAAAVADAEALAEGIGWEWLVLGVATLVLLGVVAMGVLTARRGRGRPSARTADAAGARAKELAP